jgi:hypothetical protein
MTAVQRTSSNNVLDSAIAHQHGGMEMRILMIAASLALFATGAVAQDAPVWSK